MIGANRSDWRPTDATPPTEFASKVGKAIIASAREATEAASMRGESDRLRPVLLSADRGPLHLKEIFRTLARLERTERFDAGGVVD